MRARRSGDRCESPLPPTPRLKARSSRPRSHSATRSCSGTWLPAPDTPRRRTDRSRRRRTRRSRSGCSDPGRTSVRASRCRRTRIRPDTSCSRPGSRCRSGRSAYGGARPVAGVCGARVTVVAGVREPGNARPRHACVVCSAGIAVLAGRAVRHRHVDAGAGRGIALAGLVTLIECWTHHRRAAAAGAGVAGAVVLGARACVVAGYPFVRRDAVAGARGGIADLGGAEVRVLHAGHRLGATGAAALRLHAVVHGTRIVVVADRAADRGIGAASDDVAVREVQLNIGRLRHLDRLRLRTRRHVAELRPAGVRDATERDEQEQNAPDERSSDHGTPLPARRAGLVVRF
jgi:hypothetical protein